MELVWFKYKMMGCLHEREYTKFPQVSNHEICHEMFGNAFRGCVII